MLNPTDFPDLILALIALSGLYLLGRSAWQFWQGDGSLQWPRVDGVVQQTTVEHRTAASFNVGIVPVANREPGYLVVVRYGYEVAGRTYTSSRWSFGADLLLPDEGSAAAKARQYPEGTQVKVSYDPADPQVSTLKTGDPDQRYWGAFWGLAVFLFALYGYLAK